jgi:long-chain acyl-CoA synthetase
MPEAPAVTFMGDRWSYADLWDGIARWAAFLAGRVGRGERVLCLAENHPEMLALYVATAGIGAVFVPVHPKLTTVELDHVVRTARPCLAVAGGGFVEALTASLNGTGMDIVPLVRPAVRPLAAGDLPDLDPDTGALICFTSGSTGRPKGVYASHRNEWESARQYAAVWAIGPGDRVMVALPLSFLYGLTTGCLTALLAGAEVLLEERFHPVRVLERMAAERATVFMGVPTMYAMLLEVGEAGGRRDALASARLLLTAGAPMAVGTIERFRRVFGRPIFDFYALSEVRPVFAYDVRRHVEPRPGRCGHALPGVEVRLVDDAGNDVPDGTPGELWVRSATLMKGYYGDPEQTSGVMSGGWFRTGDLVVCDSEGYYSIVGRKKDLIIRGGVNVAPAEVEAAILAHPAVAEASVVGVPDPVFGEEVAAAVVPRAGAQLGESDLLAFLSARLAEYKRPRRVRFVAELPKGANGKVQREEVRRLWSD